MTDQQLLDRIATDPKVMVGKPVVKGTRLTVEFVLKRLAHGATFDELLREYSHLSVDDIRACLLYAGRALEPTVIMSLVAESGSVETA